MTSMWKVGHWFKDHPNCLRKWRRKESNETEPPATKTQQKTKFASSGGGPTTARQLQQVAQLKRQTYEICLDYSLKLKKPQKIQPRMDNALLECQTYQIHVATHSHRH